MRKKVFRVRDVRNNRTDYVGVYKDSRTGYFSVHATTYPLSASRWQRGEDVIKAIIMYPHRFTWLKETEC